MMWLEEKYYFTEVIEVRQTKTRKTLKILLQANYKFIRYNSYCLMRNSHDLISQFERSKCSV